MGGYLTTGVAGGKGTTDSPILSYPVPKGAAITILIPLHLAAATGVSSGKVPAPAIGPVQSPPAILPAKLGAI